MAKGASTFVDDLYRRDVAGMPRWLAVLTRLGQFAFQTVSEIGRDKVFAHAAGMAYTSLLALVPATAVIFVVLAQFADLSEMLDDLQAQLIQYVVPTSGELILDYLRSAAEKTRALGVVGTIFLFVTTVLLFNSIEAAFNHIFHTRRRRSSVIKFLVFTSVLVWGPLTIGLSVWATGQLKTLVNVDLLLEQSTVFSRIAYYAMPLLLTWLAFVMAFVIIPAARVRFRSALVGGLVAGVFFEIAKIGFPAYVKKAVSYSTIYGSLSVIPFFLIWLYALWLIVLIGLEVAYTHQNFQTLLARRRYAEPPRGRERIQLALWIFGEIAAAFERGSEPPGTQELAERLQVPGEIAEGLVADLEKAGLVRPVSTESEGYVPGRALAAMPVYDLVRAVHDGEAPTRAEPGDEISLRMDELVRRIERAAQESVAGLTVAAVLSPGAPPSGKPSPGA